MNLIILLPIRIQLNKFLYEIYNHKNNSSYKHKPLNHRQRELPKKDHKFFISIRILIEIYSSIIK